MAKPTSYRMCDLRQGTARMKTYIEERGARVGKLVEVLDPEVKGLWEVIQVGDKIVSAEAIQEIQKNERNHRKATDI